LEEHSRVPFPHRPFIRKAEWVAIGSLIEILPLSCSCRVFLVHAHGRMRQLDVC